MYATSLGIVILVGTVEVPGAGDDLVCGHIICGAGVDRVTGGQAARGEIGDRRRGVRGAACGVIYHEFGALDGVSAFGTEKDDIVIENVFIS